MDNTITVGQLRQNPTAMIQDVKDGVSYTLTDRGRPVASISPYRPVVWRSAADINAVLARLGPDPAFAADIDRLRAESEIRDPWSDHE